MADYIERQAAVSRFEQLKEQADTMRDKLYLDGVLAVVDTLPSANVREDVHGKWLDPDYPICCAIKCSACGETEYLDEPGQYEHWRFCPLCGASMDGGGER